MDDRREPLDPDLVTVIERVADPQVHVFERAVPVLNLDCQRNGGPHRSVQGRVHVRGKERADLYAVAFKGRSDGPSGPSDDVRANRPGLSDWVLIPTHVSTVGTTVFRGIPPKG